MTEVLAHGISGATDLPIPLSYALIGAAWALTFSFAVLAFAWREPRLNPDSPGVALPGPARIVIDSRLTRALLGAVGLIGAIGVIVVGFAGSQDPADNPVPGLVYIFVWVGVPVASLVVGPVWKVVSPPRTVHRLLRRITGRTPEEGLFRYPGSWGNRPAAVGLFSFVWLELAFPEPGSVLAVTVWFTGYLLVNTAGLVAFGTAWAERGDPLEVYSSLLARLSPLARGRDRTIVLRWPLNNLAGTPALLGSVAVAATLLGSTAFDSFSMFTSWRNLLIEVGGDSTLITTLLRTAGLLGFIAVVGGIFILATRATGGLTREQRASLPIRLAHSLTPIVAGYIVAHYLTFLVEKGQATLILCADPFQRGWNIAGLADLDVQYILSNHPSVLATIKVIAVLAGHILGVAAAHDRCLRLLPPRHRLTGQLALMVTMVGFTFTGLYLLFEA
ncbi:hypothetical protein GV792_00260 [Nocardia cyriacigeorgica]|uniref:Fenitrothion hydrolase n=1 Tax=Nocardia cyriacigeorgica TaxID=135487 RepID=A0A6P1D586_9NOCA|nr:hypothetical protein [Nocardia cyriacigeorgica]NEW38128.1 hypothetical protein [Nocardia cyriacigeorgica]NEW45786.1 hypothetical protein [Nocardia cyriacigeorgica]NEW48489.1 hypothetical protein [Nocardia cyriacigeorgica]